MSLRRKPPGGNVRRVAAIGNNLRGTITNKTGRIVQFESFAERSLLLRLERDHSVEDYASQPERFSGEGGNHYTPDFIVWRRNGMTEIHEVTRMQRRVRQSQQAREQLAQCICQERGWRYIVHTEQNLPQSSELANLLSLLRYRPMAYRSENIFQIICHLLEPQEKMLLCELANLLVNRSPDSFQVVAASLCHELWHGRLVTNWQKSILRQAQFAPDAYIWLPCSEVEA
jgi:hypothetical protein